MRDATPSRCAASSTAASTCCARDDLRHAQREGGIVAIKEVQRERWVDLPLMISVTITDRSGRTLSGQTSTRSTSRWSTRVRSRSASTARCGHGYAPVPRRASRMAECWVTAYPTTRALPNEVRPYDEQPRDGRLLRDSRRAASSTSAAACCGTTPQPSPPRGGGRRRRAAAASDNRAAPRGSAPRAAGHPPRQQLPVIGERTNVTGSKRFMRLITSGNYTEAIAVRSISGAAARNMIDVNMARHARLGACDDRVPE